MSNIPISCKRNYKTCQFAEVVDEVVFCRNRYITAVKCLFYYPCFEVDE